MSKDGGQRHPLEPKQVGKGIDAPKHRPLDPQTWLIGSNHPYSPFPGNALKWESWVWDDGTNVRADILSPDHNLLMTFSGTS